MKQNVELYFREGCVEADLQVILLSSGNSNESFSDSELTTLVQNELENSTSGISYTLNETVFGKR